MYRDSGTHIHQFFFLLHALIHINVKKCHKFDAKDNGCHGSQDL